MNKYQLPTIIVIVTYCKYILIKKAALLSLSEFMGNFDTVGEGVSEEKPDLTNLLYSVTLWPPSGEAAPDYLVWCGSGLYSSHSSSCTGTEGGGKKAHGSKSCSGFLFFLFSSIVKTKLKLANTK